MTNNYSSISDDQQYCSPCYGIHAHLNTFSVFFWPLPFFIGQDAESDQSEGHDEEAEGIHKLRFSRQ